VQLLDEVIGGAVSENPVHLVAGTVEEHDRGEGIHRESLGRLGPGPFRIELDRHQRGQFRLHLCIAERVILESLAPRAPVGEEVHHHQGVLGRGRSGGLFERAVKPQR
jgi:hypothetical protein